MNTDSNEKKPNLRSRYGDLSAPKKVITALLALAAAFTTLWGAYQAVEGALGLWREWNDVQTELFRTPRLGLEFWQEGARNDMFFNNEGDKEIVRVSMKSGPFEMRFPRPDENGGILINGWVKDSIFNVREGTEIGENVDLAKDPKDIEDLKSPFLMGKTAADYEFGSGNLYVTRDSHMYLGSTRIAPSPGGQAKAFFTTVWISIYGDKDSGVPISTEKHPLAEQEDDIFLTVFTDKNDDDVIDRGEYEYIVLDF